MYTLHIGRIWILPIVMILLSSKGWSQVFEDTVFRKRAAYGMEVMYHQDYEKAKTLFEALQADYPNHPAPHFLLATNRWWQSYISTTEAFFPYIDQQLDAALAKNVALEKPDTQLEYIFFQYMCYAVKTRLHTHQRAWWKAANAGRKAYPYLKECLEMKDATPEFYFGAGIYHYYAEAYPEEHPYLKPIAALFPDGDAKQGMKEMELAAGQWNFTQVEATFYLIDIYLFWEKAYTKAVRLSYQLHRKYPENTWFRAEYIRACIFGERYAQARPHLNPMIAAFEAQEGVPHRHISSEESSYTSKLMIRIYYYLGRTAWADKDYDAGVEAFKKGLYQANVSGMGGYTYIAEAYYFLGRCYDALGKRKEAVQAYKSAISAEENDLIKADAYACLKSACVN